jgi:hypothetical protein
MKLGATVHEPIRTADLGEVSAINDAALRVGGAIAIAIVRALVGVTRGRNLAYTLAHDYSQ